MALTRLHEVAQHALDEVLDMRGRGNLDAARLSWLFGREVVAGEDPFDPASYEALLRIDVKRAEASFPEIFAKDAPAPDYGDWADDAEDD